LNSGKPAWCYYDNDPANGSKYGKLYNWYAINDSRGIAPKGWHVPSDTEWFCFEKYLNPTVNDINSTGWISDPERKINTCGFSPQAGGFRTKNGDFLYIEDNGCLWSSKDRDEREEYECWVYFLGSPGGDGYKYLVDKPNGYSVRCIKD
jgi:uncharacterized protein (TIGR02145 family)